VFSKYLLFVVYNTCLCLSQDLDFQRHMFGFFWWEGGGGRAVQWVRSVDMGGIVDHHCLNIIITQLSIIFFSPYISFIPRMYHIDISPPYHYFGDCIYPIEQETHDTTNTKMHALYLYIHLEIDKSFPR